MFGAIVMYIVSMLSLFALRRKEPQLERPFKAVAYPIFPAIALVLAVICLVTMVYFNQMLALIFLGMMAVSFGYYWVVVAKRAMTLKNA